MPLSYVDVAVESYLFGAIGSLRCYARIHGVVKSSVSDQKREWQSLQVAHQKQQKFVPGEELALVEHERTQALVGYPIDEPTLWRMATTILKWRVAIFLEHALERLAKHWHEGFFKLFARLAIEKIKLMEQLRISGATCPCLELYNKLFKELIESPGLLQENVYDMDETGILLGVQNKICCIMDLTVKNRIRKSSQDRESARVIECVSASKIRLSPMVIIPAKTHHNEWYPEVEPGPGQ